MDVRSACWSARRPLRDALFERFPARPGVARIRTCVAAVVATPARLVWTLGLPDGGRPPWLEDRLAGRARDARNVWRLCRSIAENGVLATLQWARAQGCDWGVGTCSGAAKGGHFETLKWLNVSGCPWDASTCCRAVEGGHLAVLQWLRARGCPWNAWTCSSAAERGDLVAPLLDFTGERRLPLQRLESRRASSALARASRAALSRRQARFCSRSAAISVYLRSP